MKIRACILIAAICCWNVSWAQLGRAEQEVLDAHNAWFAAFDRADVDAIDQMETEDFVLVNGDRIVEKRQQLENIRTGFGGGVEMTRVAGLHSFSMLGDAALIRGVQYSSSQSGGDSIIFTEVWVQDDGVWKIKSAHFSPVAAD